MAQKGLMLSLNLSDEYILKEVRAIVDYEAKMQGVSRGQAFARLIFKAAHTESYPVELRSKFDEIDLRHRQRAVEKALTELEGAELELERFGNADGGSRKLKSA